MQVSLETGLTYYLLGIAAFFLIVSGTYIFLFRGNRWQPLKNASQFSRYGSRLDLIEDYPLGYEQKLILIRRDHVEHLLFVSPETVSLIETGIPFSNDKPHDPLIKRRGQSDPSPSTPQQNLFTPPSIGTSPSVFPFPEHLPNTSPPQQTDLAIPIPQKDYNPSLPSENFRHTSFSQQPTESRGKGITVPFIPLKPSNESPFSASPAHESMHKEKKFLTEPLEKELEKIHGKVEKLSSFPPTQNKPSDFASSRISPQDAVLRADSHLESQSLIAQAQNSAPSDTQLYSSHASSSLSPTPLYPSELLNQTGFEASSRHETHVLPPLVKPFSESDHIIHKDMSIRSIASSEEVNSQKPLLEQVSSESFIEEKSGVSLQEIEEEFARLLGNRPPT